MTLEKFESEIENIDKEVGKDQKESSKKIKLEDFFEYSIDDIKKTMEESEEIDLEDKMVNSFYLSRNKKDIEEFSKENPDKLEEFLIKLKDWKPEIQIEKSRAKIKNVNPKMFEDDLKYKFLAEIIKFEKINPSEKIKKFLDKIISLNGGASFSDLEDLEDINPTEEEMDLLEKMAEISTEPSFGFNWVDTIKDLRKGTLTDKKKGILSILGDNEEFEKAKENIRELEKEYKKDGLLLNIDWYDFELGKEEVKEKPLSEIKNIKELAEIYDFSKVISSGELNPFLFSSEEVKKEFFSENFKDRIDSFKIKINSLYDLVKTQETFKTKENIISRRDSDFKKILSDFNIKEIERNNIEWLFDLDEKEIDNVLERDFSDSSLRIKSMPMIKKSPFYKEISSKFIDNIKKERGDYSAKVFPLDLLKYISSSLALSYLTLKERKKEGLEKLKEKNPEIHRKILQKDLKLEDFIPGKKATRTLIGKGNIEYLLAANNLNIPLDFYGIQGKNIEEIKKEVNKKAEELLENYPQNKERYLPYVDSLVGYASKYKKQVNEILKIENLWDFKFSHIPDLYSILEKIRDLPPEKIKETKAEREIQEEKIKEDIESSSPLLEESLNKEHFTEARERINLIKPENKGKALKFIERMENVVATLKEGKVPSETDINILFSGKNIFKDLELFFTLQTIKDIYQKRIQISKEKGEFLRTVKIVRKPEEYFEALNIQPSCFRVGQPYDIAPLTVAQAPILCLAVKDELGKAKGASLLIPIKDKEDRWGFELEPTYGVGGEYIENFAKKIGKILKEGNEEYYQGIEKVVTRDFIKGKLLPTKKTPSTGSLIFYRDNEGEVKLEEYKENT